MAYSESELIQAIESQLASDAGFRAQIAKAVAGKKRGRVATLIIDSAKFLFGNAVSHIVERVIDWFMERF